MKIERLNLDTSGEKFYPITSLVQKKCQEMSLKQSGILYLYCTHTSAGLCITESFEDSAVSDMEIFLKQLAPRNLSFISHKTEGEDDSPSHMKSILLQSQLFLFVESGRLVLGQWQGLFLCEFRDGPKNRQILLKFVPDEA